jgi:rod shape determining protein RodA
MRRQYKSFDYVLLIMVCIVAIMGIIVIGSATHINVNGVSPEFKGQIVWFISGFVFLLFAAFIDYHFICKFYIWMYLVNLTLLIIVLLVNRDEVVARWIYIGGATIQPSEFAKILMLLFLSTLISKYNKTLNNFGLVTLIAILSAIPVFLIRIQPSLSASIVFIALTLVLLYIGGISYRYIYVSLISVIPAAYLFFLDIKSTSPLLLKFKIMDEYQIKRLTDLFFETGDKFQTGYSVSAIATGKLKGQGLYSGMLNQLDYIVESHNDFIFAVIGEEFGFIGTISLLMFLLLIILKCMYVSFKAPDLLGKLIASGVGTIYAFQVFVNVGVATDILPNTGIAMPLVSYGGSAMWVNMIAIGLVINVGMSKTKSIFEE